MKTSRVRNLLARRGPLRAYVRGRQLDRDALSDQAALLAPYVPAPIIVDVGAHTGDVSARYLERFPACRLFALEPNAGSFHSLSARFAEDERVTTLNLGLAEAAGPATLYLRQEATTHSLVPVAARPRYLPASSAAGTQSIELDTLDRLAARYALPRVDLLKVDVEGAELKVLEGARELLCAERIAVVFVETMFYPHYAAQPLFWQICGFLADHGMSLFNLYELRIAGNGQLRWGNALFVAPSLRRRLDGDLATP